MSEVSLEAESGKTSAVEPQMDCEEAERAAESQTVDVTQENVDTAGESEGRAEVLYDIDIDSGEESAGSSDRCEDEEERGDQRERVVMHSNAANTTDSVDSGEDDRNTPETAEESGDSKTEKKVMLNLAACNLCVLSYVL